MLLKLLFFVCLAVASHAGLVSPVYSAPYAYGGWNPYSNYPAQPAVASQHSNILRSPFNLGQVSTYTKSIDTPFSSVRKADVRVSNPGVGVAYTPGYSHFASPVVSHVGVAPVAKLLFFVCLAVASHAGLVSPVYSAPYAYGGWNPYSNYPAQPAVASQHSNILRSPFNLGQVSTYTKSIDTPFSSVRKADVRVSNPGVGVAYTPGYSHFASPVVSHVGVAPVAKVATAGLLGVAYSAAPTVSHMTYTNGLGLAYGW